MILQRLVLLFMLLVASSVAWILPTSSIHRRCRPFHTSTVSFLNRILFEVSEITNHTAASVFALKDADGDATEGGGGEERSRAIPVVEIPKDDYRTIHVAKILSLPNGATLRSGIVSCDQYPEGLWTDSATIEWLPEGKVKKKAPLGNGKPPGSLRVHLSQLTTTPPPTQTTAAVSLVLALPRPLQLGRLLPVIASMGCDTLYLISAAKVPRDYWGSHLLRGGTTTTNSNSTTPAAITALLTEGLAQSGDTRLPRVVLHKGSLRKFLEQQQQQGWAATATPTTRPTKLVAHPTRLHTTTSASQRIRDVAPPGIPIVIAVGPEGGWEEPDELDLLVQRHAFIPVTLGHRTLRTDTAVVSLLALAQDAYVAE